MQKKDFILRWLAIFWLVLINSSASAQDLKPASSMNPVGSGARAMGMGGAFIGVADDATAASWNPGGLLQLDTPEISVVGNWFHRTEDNSFVSNPEADGSYSVAEMNLNYFSFVYPINFSFQGEPEKGFEPNPEQKNWLRFANMVFAVNYQHLYDFTREWKGFSLHEDGTDIDIIDFQLEGGLSAIGIAWGIKLHPQFYLGATVNFWDDQLFCDDNLNSRWKSNYYKYYKKGPLPEYSRTKEEYLFSGMNFNIGILWHTENDNFKIGAVFKSPFKGNLEFKSVGVENFGYFEEGNFVPQGNPGYNFNSWSGNLKMPMSYGIGFSWRFAPRFTLSTDIYRTEWGDYIIQIPGEEEISLITGLPVSESDIDPTHQIRAGLEYIWLRTGYLIPLRCGVFYDPEPAKGNPDDVCGLSAGTGVTANRFSFDVAFEWRFGRDVASSMVPEKYQFSQDINEYKVYSSFILYFD